MSTDNRAMKLTDLTLPDLSDVERLFVLEYFLSGFNPGKAYKAATCDEKGPYGAKGHSWLTKTHIRAAVDHEMDKFVSNKEQLAARVVQEVASAALADANNLVEHRRVNCRHCWGDNHLWQHTAGEWAKLVADYEKDCYTATVRDLPTPPDPNFAGGLGYRKNRDPNPDCPECDGEGISSVHFKDTRKLGHSNGMYAGVKKTKDGMELLTASKQVAQDKLMRHLNMFEKDQKAGAGEIHVHLDDKDARA